MTRAHLTTAELDAYLARQFSASDLLEASDHLAGCEECRASVGRLLEARRVSFNEQEVDPVSYGEMADLLDDQLDPLARREITSKLSRSESVRRELADLAQFRAHMNAEPDQDFNAGSFGSGKIVAFSRWALPLAAAVLLSAVGIWWIMQSRATGSSGLQALSPELQMEVKEVFRQGKIEIPADILQLRGRKGTLAGSNAPSEFRVLRPVATAVRETAPRFQWQNFPGATGYRINIIDLETGELVVSEQVPADTMSWVSVKPFVAGKSYEWEIEAWRNDKMIAKTPAPPLPEARFKILSAEQSAKLKQLEQQSSASRLIVGTAKARLGLLDEAEADLETLTGKNQDAEMAGRLLDQLRRERAAQP
jgi:hypothetical protein